MCSAQGASPHSDPQPHASTLSKPVTCRECAVSRTAAVGKFRQNSMADVQFVDETQVVFPDNSMLCSLSQAGQRGLSEPFTDVKVVTKTEHFQAHRIKLAVSKQLRQMMGLNPDSDTLEMPEMATSEMQTLLEIAYAGEALQLIPSNIVKVTTVADKWDSSLQRARCMDWLRASLDDLEDWREQELIIQQLSQPVLADCINGMLGRFKESAAAAAAAQKSAVDVMAQNASLEARLAGETTRCASKEQILRNNTDNHEAALRNLSRQVGVFKKGVSLGIGSNHRELRLDELKKIVNKVDDIISSNFNYYQRFHSSATGWDA